MSGFSTNSSSDFSTNPSAKSQPERIGARLRVCPDAKKNLFSKFLKRRTGANPAARRPRGVRVWENFEPTKGYHRETKGNGCQCDPAAASSVSKTPMITATEPISCSISPKVRSISCSRMVTHEHQGLESRDRALFCSMITPLAAMPAQHEAPRRPSTPSMPIDAADAGRCVN